MIFDGSKLDIITLGVAFLASIIRPIKRYGSDKKTNRQEIGVDFLNGTALVPFGIMVISVMSSEIMTMAMSGDRLFFGVGGGLGLIFVVAELMKP